MAINYLLIMTKANSGYWANMVCFFYQFHNLFSEQRPQNALRQQQ